MPFFQKGPHYRVKWGYSFQGTRDHLTEWDLRDLHDSYDYLGEDAFRHLLPLIDESHPEGSNLPDPDLYLALASPQSDHIWITRLWNEVHQIPSWVDWDQIERGQKLFARFGLANCVVFALHGFLQMSILSPAIAEVFARTPGFESKSILSRFTTNLDFLIRATSSIESIQPGGEAYTHIIHTHLLHCSVRHRIMEAWNARAPGCLIPEQFSAAVYDIDALHAVSLFCASPLWESLPKMGVWAMHREVQDWVAFWRYVAYLMCPPGESNVYWQDGYMAKATMESLIFMELEPSKTARKNVDLFFKRVESATSGYISRGILEAGCRTLNGSKLCDALEVGRPRFYHYICFYAVCLVVCFMAILQRLIPPFDHFVTAFFRGFLFPAITEQLNPLALNKNLFDFSFVRQSKRRIEQRKQRVTRRVNNMVDKPLHVANRELKKSKMLRLAGILLLVFLGPVAVVGCYHFVNFVIESVVAVIIEAYVLCR